MKKNKKYIIFVKSKSGYPNEWIPIQTNNIDYWLSGSNCWIPLFNDYKAVTKAVYLIKKQLKRFDLIFRTERVQSDCNCKNKTVS